MVLLCVEVPRETSISDTNQQVLVNTGEGKGGGGGGMRHKVERVWLSQLGCTMYTVSAHNCQNYTIQVQYVNVYANVAQAQSMHTCIHVLIHIYM